MNVGVHKFSEKFTNLIKRFSNVHFDKGENIVIFSIPRSGSTWLMELIKTQDGFKICNEPLNIREPIIAEALGIGNWNELYSEEFSRNILQYFVEIVNGKHKYLNGNPLREFYRPISTRIVFKVINGGELIINEISKAANARVIYLLRHPIPVSLSRRLLPRIEVLSSENIIQHLDSEERNLARKLRSVDSHIILATLSWCIQTKLALNNANDDWTILTYEQLVLNPDPIVDYLAKKYNLSSKERIVLRLRKPSAVTVQSDPGTKEDILNSEGIELINKWRTQISPDTESQIYEILEVFGLNIYDRFTSTPLKYIIK